MTIGYKPLTPEQLFGAVENQGGNLERHYRAIERAAIENYLAQHPVQSVTIADAPMLGGIAGIRGISRDVAYAAFHVGASTVEVYTGARTVFYTMADFDAAIAAAKGKE